MRLLVKKIAPRRTALLDIDYLRSELEDALDEVKQGVLSDFESTVSTWETPVGFKGQKVITTSGIAVDVQPIGDGAKIWGYLNDGTERHWVGPRNGSALRFQPGYRSKTRPGRIGSGGGGAFGPFAFSKGHWVSGIEPRDFTGQIAEKWKPEFKRIGENAMRRVARR